jgi:hypothetical protein
MPSDVSTSENPRKESPRLGKPETGAYLVCSASSCKSLQPHFRGKKEEILSTFQKDISQSGMYKFESSQASHAVGPAENWAVTMAEKPANGGLLRFGARSSDSQFDGLRGEIVESLWRFFEIFPFSGDGGRRSGSISTEQPGLQCKLAKLSGSAAGKLGVAGLRFAETIGGDGFDYDCRPRAPASLLALDQRRPTLVRLTRAVVLASPSSRTIGRGLILFSKSRIIPP